jgi:hypothetical protein
VGLRSDGSTMRSGSVILPSLPAVATFTTGDWLWKAGDEVIVGAHPKYRIVDVIYEYDPDVQGVFVVARLSPFRESPKGQDRKEAAPSESCPCSVDAAAREDL